MDKKTKATLLDEAVQRATKTGDSMQPRLNPKTKDQAVSFYQSVYNWLLTDPNMITEPERKVDSRIRDGWLSTVWLKEPYLAGVIQSVVSIDKNRGWTLIGGRNQVNAYTKILHNFEVAPGISGWRAGISAAAESYYTTDLGSVIELGRSGDHGPLRRLYHADPCSCQLTGNADTPLQYTPVGQQPQKWLADDFLHIVSMPSRSERMYGLGYCAVSRCIELTKIMIAIYQYDRERLTGLDRKGLLLLTGVSQLNWNKSLEARKIEDMTDTQRRYYRNLQVLAQEIGTIDAKMVPLTNLPDGFDIKVFTDLLMNGYALAFGYDTREFWPISGGALGTATETETMHQKATAKGGLDFVLNFQEQLQLQLPASLAFQFDQRDEQGDLLAETVKQAKAQTISILYSTGLMQGAGIIDREEARQLCVEAGLIPQDWAAEAQEAEATDLETTETRDLWLSNVHVQRAASEFPNEPIIKYQYPTGRVKVIAATGDDLLQRVTFPGLNKDRSIVPSVRSLVAEAQKLIDDDRPMRIIGDIMPQDTRIRLPDIVIRQAEPAPIVIPAPVVNITVPQGDAPTVTVNVPEQTQPAPIVNIAPAQVNVEAAQVTVNVPEQPAPIVQNTISIPDPKPHAFKISRDGSGNISGLSES